MKATDLELAARLLAEHKERIRKSQEASEARAEHLKGYLFWCSEGCGFVDEHHRCEQWASVTYIPPGAVEAIRQRKAKR